MTPEERELCRASLYVQAARMGRTVVDTVPGVTDDGRTTCKVFDAVTTRVLAEFEGTPAQITEAFDFAANGEWITVAKIEEAVDEMAAAGDDHEGVA